MKKTLFKNFYRTIFRTFPKFVSIVFMIALGVMVFVGLKITPYIMRRSVDERVKEGNLYDYKISSNFGLQKEDENIISNLKNLKDVEYGYSINLKDEDRKVDFTIENKPEKISTVQVVEGKDIESNSDILLDERLKDKYKIGDEIDFKNVEKFGIFKDEVKKLKQNKFTVKGFIKSPEVLTTLLMGTTENGYLAIVSKDTFDFSYFSYAKITFSDLNGLNRNSKEYKKLSSKRKTELQDSFKGRAGEVYNVIYAQKREALDEIKKMGIFELLEEANQIPIVCWRLKENANVQWTLYDLEDRLRMHGWMIPAYPMPENIKDVDVQRLVLRQDFGMPLAILCINEMKKQIEILNGSRVVLHDNEKNAKPDKGFDHSGR